MRLFKLLLITPLIFSLGCSAKHDSDNETSLAESSSHSSKLEGVFTEAQNKTLKKSQQVDDLLQDANNKRLKEADE